MREREREIGNIEREKEKEAYGQVKIEKVNKIEILKNEGNRNDLKLVIQF